MATKPKASFSAPPKPQTAKQFVAGSPSAGQPDAGTNGLVRVNIQITKQQHDALRRIAFDRSLKNDQRASQAELVREALDAWLQSKGGAK